MVPAKQPLIQAALLSLTGVCRLQFAWVWASVAFGLAADLPNASPDLND
jgi:hypothetical protein